MFRFLLNFIGFLLSFVFTEKIMHEVWHLRNVIYSMIVFITIEQPKLIRNIRV